MKKVVGERPVYVVIASLSVPHNSRAIFCEVLRMEGLLRLKKVCVNCEFVRVRVEFGVCDSLTYED